MTHLASSGLLIVPALYLLANLYLYKWFMRMARPPARMRISIRLAFILLVVLFPVSKLLGRHDFNSFSQLLNFVSSIWMGLTLYSCVLAMGSDLLFVLFRRLDFSFKFFRVPSLFHRRLVAGCMAAGVLAIGGYSFWEARNIEITRLEIPLRNLPPDLDGISLVQLSDVHYGMLNENGRLSDIVRRVNALDPDFVVITGDLVDEGVAHMEEMAGPLSNLKARLGVFAVTGNHEFFSSVDRTVAIMEQAGIRVLRNETAVLPGGLQILGIDDPTVWRRTGKPLPDFDNLIAGLDPDKPSLLLYHQPVHFDKVASCGVGLQLSGHTHGPQLLPMRPLAWLFFPRTRGLFQVGESRLYVSRGVGTGGPPMRHGSFPELVYIRLRSQG